MEDIKSTESLEVTKQSKTKASSNQVNVFEEYGHRIAYKTMPNKPLNWLQKLERSYGFQTEDN